MFDRIARRYDLLNRVISLRLDGYWRKKAVQAVFQDSDQLILDLGAGTGDLAFTAATRVRGRGRVVGLDFSFEMLKLAQAKRAHAPNADMTSFVLGSALAPPFRGATFDGVVTAFVLRNVSDLTLFFRRAFQVLKPGGKLASLDMYPPSKSLFSIFYSLYFYRAVPCIGQVLAGDRSAYQYLSESVRRFEPPEKICLLIQRAGFERVSVRKFLFGAVCLHVAEKSSRAD
jgi:demethylmenaquinone methyltransferase/2-methoxy-6-polyprenyl-1,4-benzoquinol methylase